LAAEIESKFSVTAKLIKAGGGCFEVVANEQLVFSKNAEKRFPENSEVIASLSKLAANH
jgi:selT/selW/selH-like putative selenoprotein